MLIPVGPELAREMRQILQEVPQQTHWAPPLHERSAASAVLALANGVRCYQAPSGKVWRPSPQDLVEIMEESAAYQEKLAGPPALDEYPCNTASVAHVLTEYGVLSGYQPAPDPLQAARAMAAGGFAALSYTHNPRLHATIMPNLTGSKKDGTLIDLISIDARDGSQTALRAAAFGSMVLNQEEYNAMLTICTVAPNTAGGLL